MCLPNILEMPSPGVAAKPELTAKEAEKERTKEDGEEQNEDGDKQPWWYYVHWIWHTFKSEAKITFNEEEECKGTTSLVYL